MTNFTTDNNGAQVAANGLMAIFGEKTESNYSKGFVRWSKLSLAKKKALMIKNDFSYDSCIAELENA